jgi:hypothetical protein
MGIRLQRFPEHRLDFSVYSGVVTVEQVVQHFKKLDATANWLSYFDATADLSAIDLGHFPELKRALTALEARRDSDETRLCLLVNAAPVNEDFARFWCAYASEGIAHAHRRDMFPTLEAAFDRLGLPHDARAALATQAA